MSSTADRPQVQGVSNRFVGSLILLTALTLFGAYTVWALVLPFLPDDSPIHASIPSRRWAITIPSLVLVVGLGTVGIYIGLLLRHDALHDLAQQKDKLTASRRAAG